MTADGHVLKQAGLTFVLPERRTARLLWIEAEE
jgi:hypothetical protein